MKSGRSRDLHIPFTVTVIVISLRSADGQGHHNLIVEQHLCFSAGANNS
jgi:hypothetical protein